MPKNIKKFTKISIMVLLSISFFLPAYSAHAQEVQCQNMKEGDVCTAGNKTITYTGIDEFGNRKFIVKEVNLGTDERYIDSPYLTDYLAAIYRYAVIATTILATIVIIFAGVLWITSAGNTEQIGRAKKMIARAITGLILAVGSYTILWTINPQLVEFGSLKILRVQDLSLEDALLGEQDNITYSGENAGLKPTWDANTFDCSKQDSVLKYPPAGVADPKTLYTFTSCPNPGAVIAGGKFILKKEMGDALCKVAENLYAKGYQLYIGSNYRPFDKQVTNWCGHGAKNYPDVNERKKYNAVPGYSNHGHGIAVDVKLLDKNGKPLYEQSSTIQCKVNPEYVKILADAFYETDPNFVRLETEIWHFEYGTLGRQLRSKTNSLPSACK